MMYVSSLIAMLTAAIIVPLAFISAFGYSKKKKKIMRGGPLTPIIPPRNPLRKPARSIHSMTGLIGHNCFNMSVLFGTSGEMFFFLKLELTM